jgi:hypothetical protein
MRIHFVIVPLLTLVAIGCTRQEANQQGLVAESHDRMVADLHWSYPSRWQQGADRPMRAATYLVPAAEGDSEGGECAVFYFGPDQGGGVELNIERWGSQFENAGEALKTTMKVNGISVTRVAIAGAYLAPAGPMQESTGKKENFRLLGAIVEAPGGLVFFKLTGPAKSIDMAEREFDAMIGSISTH